MAVRLQDGGPAVASRRGAVADARAGEGIVARQAGLWPWIVGMALVVAALWTSGIAWAATGSVSIVEFSFQPTPIAVNVGDTVTWTNNGSFNHTTTGASSAWNSGPLSPGQ